MDEPFCLRKWEIEKLDRWWIYNVYFRARDDHGKLIVMPKGVVEEEVAGTYTKTAFYQYYEERGVPQWDIDGLWRDFKEQSDG